MASAPLSQQRRLRILLVVAAALPIVAIVLTCSSWLLADLHDSVGARRTHFWGAVAAGAWLADIGAIAILLGLAALGPEQPPR